MSFGTCGFMTWAWRGSTGPCKFMDSPMDKKRRKPNSFDALRATRACIRRDLCSLQAVNAGRCLLRDLLRRIAAETILAIRRGRCRRPARVCLFIYVAVEQKKWQPAGNDRQALEVVGENKFHHAADTNRATLLRFYILLCMRQSSVRFVCIVVSRVGFQSLISA